MTKLVTQHDTLVRNGVFDLDDESYADAFCYNHLGSLAYIGNAAAFELGNHSFVGGLVSWLENIGVLSSLLIHILGCYVRLEICLLVRASIVENQGSPDGGLGRPVRISQTISSSPPTMLILRLAGVCLGATYQRSRLWEQRVYPHGSISFY